MASLKKECVESGDLVIREAVRRIYRGIEKEAVLKPPLGLPGPQLQIPPPPIFVPGQGVQPLEKVVNTAFPSLDLKDEVYAQGALELILDFLKLDSNALDNPLQFPQYAN